MRVTVVAIPMTVNVFCEQCDAMGNHAAPMNTTRPKPEYLVVAILRIIPQRTLQLLEAKDQPPAYSTLHP